MRRLLLALSVAALAVTGCARQYMTDPVDIGGGKYIIASYSKMVSVEKVKMLERASRFCRERTGTTAQVEKVDVIEAGRSRIKRDAAKARQGEISTDRVGTSSQEGSSMSVYETSTKQVGSIEIIFKCSSDRF